MPFCIGWVENFDEVTLSCTVKEIEANLCFSIFDKNSKIAAICGGGGIFFLIAKNTFLTNHVGRKFRRNRSISSNFVFCHFGQKFENSKWPPYVGRGKFLKIAKEYIAQIPCGSKISTKSLYLTRLRR